MRSTLQRTTGVVLTALLARALLLPFCRGAVERALRPLMAMEELAAGRTP